MNGPKHNSVQVLDDERPAAAPNEIADVSRPAIRPAAERRAPADPCVRTDSTRERFQRLLLQALSAWPT